MTIVLVMLGPQMGIAHGTTPQGEPTMKLQIQDAQSGITVQVEIVGVEAIQAFKQGVDPIAVRGFLSPDDLKGFK